MESSELNIFAWLFEQDIANYKTGFSTKKSCYPPTPLQIPAIQKIDSWFFVAKKNGDSDFSDLPVQIYLDTKLPSWKSHHGPSV